MKSSEFLRTKIQPMLANKKAPSDVAALVQVACAPMRDANKNSELPAVYKDSFYWYNPHLTLHLFLMSSSESYRGWYQDRYAAYVAKRRNNGDKRLILGLDVRAKDVPYKTEMRKYAQRWVQYLIDEYEAKGD